ncbi:hypothetical protein A9Q84_21550 [Halobacteriovorax marinus]|uniref:FHA domain-containing protein n=1 Tax=Halobacteriovorax marinus TaxID=97084 RepID=A0A1Y5F5R0_9BACT|nr:hypothetical protein A9Q84_21550 [Halobacteriovorax marinus]
MICFEITDSSTPYILGSHTYKGNILTIGHSNSCTLIDPKSENLEMSLSKDKLYIENLRAGYFYKVNGKKISGKKVIAKGDVVNFSNITFTVLEFSYNHIDPITDIDNLYKKRIEESPELEEILSLIEKEFIHLEKIKYDEK